jgi:hypothetical protein
VDADIQVGQVVRQASKPLTHLVKLDKAGALRSMCGVPIREGNGWHHDAGDLSCPTCRAASVRPHRSGGPPEATERPSAREAVCVAVDGPHRVPSPTGQHMLNSLSADLKGVQVKDGWCVWCAATLPLPPASQELVSYTPGVF